jgi:DNA-binding IclR family transcriptional regulator
VTGLVPAQRCFDLSETLGTQLEATRRRDYGAVAGAGEPGRAAKAKRVGTISIAGPMPPMTSRRPELLADDVRRAAAELSAGWPIGDFARGFLMLMRAAA